MLWEWSLTGRKALQELFLHNLCGELVIRIFITTWFGFDGIRAYIHLNKIIRLGHVTPYSLTQPLSKNTVFRFSGNQTHTKNIKTKQQRGLMREKKISIFKYGGRVKTRQKFLSLLTGLNTSRKCSVHPAPKPMFLDTKQRVFKHWCEWKSCPSEV